MKQHAGTLPLELPKAEAFIRGASTFSVVCKEPFDEVAQRLEGLLVKDELAIVHRHDVDRMLESQGLQLGFRCRVYEIFPARIAGRLVAMDEGLVHLLPYRIALQDRGTVSTVTTPMPTLLLTEFSDSAAVARLARQFEAALLWVLRGLR
jgi:uncharacterized protein (DUF302 family)